MGTQELIALATCVYAVLTGLILIVLGAAAYWARGQVKVIKGQLKVMRRDSMRELVKNLMEQWQSATMVDARDTLGRMLKQEVSKSPGMATEAELLKQKLNELEELKSHLFRHLMRIPHYFEMVSTLVESDDEAVREVITLFRETIIGFYNLYEPWINEKRKATNMERLYVEFEKLYKHALAAREQ